MYTFAFVEGGPLKSFEALIETEMDKSIKHFEKELTKVRTGRAHPSMVEDIKVSSYGTFMPLKQVAALSAQDAQTIVIQPWDKGLIVDIEKAISLSDLGVTPINDGQLIRIPLPKMSAARRDELSKIVAQRLEECKISIRTVRKELNTLIEKAEKGKKISEDYSKRLQDTLEKGTKRFTELAEKSSLKKQAEIKEI